MKNGLELRQNGIDLNNAKGILLVETKAGTKEKIIRIIRI